MNSIPERQKCHPCIKAVKNQTNHFLQMELNVDKKIQYKGPCGRQGDLHDSFPPWPHIVLVSASNKLSWSCRLWWPIIFLIYNNHTGYFLWLLPTLKFLSTKKLILARLGLSRTIYVNADSPNLGFQYLELLGGRQLKKHLYFIFCYGLSGNSSTSFPHKIPTNSHCGPVDDLNKGDDTAA